MLDYSAYLTELKERGCCPNTGTASTSAARLCAWWGNKSSDLDFYVIINILWGSLTMAVEAVGCLSPAQTRSTGLCAFSGNEDVRFQPFLFAGGFLCHAAAWEAGAQSPVCRLSHRSCTTSMSLVDISVR